jgi:hypothetical protein
VRKQFISNAGYSMVTLWQDGSWVTKSVHRIVATAFLPNPERKRVVNHKDLNKLNNSVENLEWVSASDNNLHYFNGMPRDADIDRIILERLPGYRSGWRYHCKCPNCGITYWVRGSNLKAGQKVFCSRRCGLDYKKRHKC